MPLPALTMAAGRGAAALRDLRNATGAATTAVSLTSAVALRLSWQFLIPSFGLTLLYLNLHFIGRYLAHARWFSPFGTEWTMTKLAPGRPNIALEYGEIVALIALDAIAVCAALAIAVLVILVGWAFAHPCEFAAAAGPEIAAAFGPLGAAAAAACRIGGG